METTPISECQSQTSSTDFKPVDAENNFPMEASCLTTSDQQGRQYDGLANIGQTSANTELINSINTIETKNENIVTSSQSGIFNCDGDVNNTSNSIATLEKITSRLNSLIHSQVSTEKVEKKCNSYTEMAMEPDTYDYDHAKRRKVDLYGLDVGPKIYNVKGKLVTPPIIAKNLPEIFDVLPIFGRTGPKEDIETFYSQKIREFVGCDLNEKQFKTLANECSPDLLRTGGELKMSTPMPTLSVSYEEDNREYNEQPSGLCIVRKQQLRLASDFNGAYQKRLKYRGTRLIPISQTEENGDVQEPDLVPGRDIMYVVRIYRPFPYNVKEKHASSRHSVFSRALVLAGRLPLSALRDRVVCANDIGVRVDASQAPDDQPAASAKDLFPSGFLFINNVFYVDNRAGCSDRSAPLRSWARARGLGDFQARDLHCTRLDELIVRLGHPEVYVHQGNCEHIFTFSEIRLLNPDDPLSLKQYPAYTAISQNQTVYCTTCAEFGAKWIVTNCSTVPFDPAYFCETCFKLLLYKDGKKIGDFKAFAYRGNEINMLKPSG